MISWVDIADRIKTIEDKGAAQAKAAAADSAIAKKHDEEFTAIKKTMNFWDKYLFGWFANKEKVLARNTQKNLRDQFQASADKNSEEASRAPDYVQDMLDRHLDDNDDAYKNLKNIHETHSEMKSTVDRFSNKVQSAYDAVSSASTMEFADLLTDNSAVSLMSSFSNSSADSEIRDVKSAMPSFKAAVEKYTDQLDTLNTESIKLKGVSDTLDLVLDVAGFSLGGLDIGSIFQLSALSDAKEDLYDLNSKVDDIHKKVSNNCNKASSALAEYRRGVYNRAITAGKL